MQRSQAAAAGEEPTDISREFLEALPPDIREELLQQEAQDRRRREREEERRRRVAANGGSTSRGEEMDPASFLASLDPTLRQAVLMEQDEEVLAQLPQAIAAEARALGGDRIMGRFADMPRLDRVRGIRQATRDQQIPKKPPRRQIVQMLDKAGVATLLRLMFIPQQGSSRHSLNGVLLDVSQNRQNRAEVVSLLLSILQDGSADVHAVERSFTHLSLRAKPQAVQRTPQTLKRTLTSQMTSLNNTEMTPLMVIQQCLSALVHLTQYNPHIPSFFLTEHDTSSGLKGKSTRKGKGRETKASKYALNALLSLIDRKLIMESSSCMEQLASLLQSVTHPLTMLNRKDKEKHDSEKVNENPSNSADANFPNMNEAGASGQEGQQPDVSTEMPDVESNVRSDDQESVLAPANSLNTGAPLDPELKQDELEKGMDEETGKKQRTLTPPTIPEENLRLVVNILAARECSAKTFRDTLSTINNLSAIPGARDVFGKGLIEQAQSLAQAILGDLDKLVPQIEQAESGTDIQAMALAKFSPASSDQAKLLRVLTALNYLFDPSQNNGKTKLAQDSKSQTRGESHLKEDLLSSFYENPTFVALWTKLSDCLCVIRQGEGMLNIATILLPLIEALMVVCKNTTFNSPLVRAAKEFAVTSPPPESRMENLFFRFTEDHRKILNDLVRNNPKLMSGTFSLLVKNPKVLEFDNKRNYFTRRLHSRGAEARHPQPPLQLSVRRDQVFLDSFKFLSFKSGDEIKYGKLSIRFHGEEGVDAGGVTREWFQVLSRQMFNPDYALFTPVASDRTTFHPSNKSKVNEEHLMFFKFIGRIIGKALYEGRPLDCHFSRAVYKRILGKTVSMKDMETLDEKYYKSLLWMLENDITGVIDLTFSIETDEFGVKQVVDLVENGRNIPVTEENKQDYIQHEIAYRLTGSVQAQLEQFLNGTSKPKTEIDVY
jgi:E3 ubiquitin-protein ligase HUWE1